jgi:hypothetical protein
MLIFYYISNEPIIEFHSIAGNSSVFYPFALTNNYAYLMLDSVYLERDFGDKDPYPIYYDNKKTKHSYNYYNFMSLHE